MKSETTVRHGRQGCGLLAPGDSGTRPGESMNPLPSPGFDSVFEHATEKHFYMSTHPPDKNRLMILCKEDRLAGFRSYSI